MKVLSGRYQRTFAQLPELASKFIDPEDPQYLASRLRDVLIDCAGRAVTVLSADAVIVFEWDARGARFVPDPLGPAQVGVKAPEHMGVEVDVNDVAARVIKSESGKKLYGTSEFRRLFRSPFEERPSETRPFAVREEIEALAVLTLKAGAETVGVMFVNFRTPHEFAEEEGEVYDAFATYAALAIRFARMTREVPRTVHEILGKTLNPILGRTLGDLQSIARELGTDEVLDGQRISRAKATVDELVTFSRWYAEAYAEGELEEVPMRGVLTIWETAAARWHDATDHFRLEVSVRMESVPDYSVAARVAHLTDIADSLLRTALEQRSTRVEVRASVRDGTTVEIEVSDNGEMFAEPAQVFEFDASKVLPEGRGRTLWWCRTALLKDGGSLALRSAPDGQHATSPRGNRFVLRLPIKVRAPPPATA
jgi:signal transduction histidine kinase